MELAPDEVRVVAELDDLHELLVGRRARKDEPGRRERLLVLAGELVAVAVTLGDLERPVGLGRHRVGREDARERAEAHRGPLVAQ